ncbi:MAG: UDP-N-acetylenolpyruvoylglucosamine reductase [Omnitrophica bacterium RIFOXYB12_FULL_50_7]|nr:MAG: UDP-N-acetylenolpyruvoylglucosamine reductase [Omnitrophica bacterium RIFOXYB12_FULL_50_7]
MTSTPALQRNVPLASHTTLRIGGPAAYFAEPESEEDLAKLLAWARREGLSFFILGNGSNVVFEDSGYEGLVISMRRFRNDLIKMDLDRSQVTVSAGVSLARLVRFCQESGLAGTEFLAQIPGTVGGALVMNAGFSRHSGQMSEIGDIVQEVRALQKDGAPVMLGREDLEFSYRHSNLDEYLLLEAILKLWRRPKDQIQNEIKANHDFRKTRLDITEPNAGSIFKNPLGPHPSAGALIEKAGWKGKRIGGIQISEQHANYFLNIGNATSKDVLQLIKEVQKAVFHATGITLEPEIRIAQKN